MGSGKSYIGKKLASTLGFHFLDIDSLIENTEGETIPQIFETKGETYFRQVESDNLRGLSKWADLVVSTGGGAACFHDNMKWMNENGTTVFLDATPELLLERLLPQTEHRPLLKDKSPEALLDFIKTKIAERLPFYSQAKITIHQAHNTDDIIFEILQKILELRQSN